MTTPSDSSTQVITYYLEMTQPGSHQLAQLRDPSLEAEIDVRCIEEPQFQYNRFLYQLVGEAWQWTDKLVWSDEQWQELVESPNHQTWVAYFKGAVLGYFELNRDGNDVEILYFGLAPQFIGQGKGGYLLSRAIETAWQWISEASLPQVERVWVHTCSLDHPSALANYKARGLSLYKTEIEN